jgi:hypothetical protein
VNTNLIQPFLLPNHFFVPQSEEDSQEARRTLTKQIFQLSYYGKLDATFVSGLEISERNYLYKLLKEQLDAENKAQEKQASKSNAQAASMRSKVSSMRRR